MHPPEPQPNSDGAPLLGPVPPGEPSHPCDPEAWPGAGREELAERFEQVRPRLEKIVAFRMDPKLRPRLDPHDVLQDAYLQIARRVADRSKVPAEENFEEEIPWFVWVRQQVLQTLIDLQRGHWREKRSVHRESRMPTPPSGQTTSMSIASVLADHQPSPSRVAMLAEEREQLHLALDSMNETDREVLALRHFEHLSNTEVAQVLGISPTAASNRYVRAAARLAEILQGLSIASGRPPQS
jgi:RNA polymerase sigma-70 factor (ECF subfamily)